MSNTGSGPSPARRLSRHPGFLQGAARGHLCWSALAALAALTLFSPLAQAQSIGDTARPPGTAAFPDAIPSAEVSLTPDKVAVEPVAHDGDIRQRLQRVMDTTGWFTNLKIEVKDGVVFLDGAVQTDDTKKWASNLASSTEDVTAVVNRLYISKPSAWDFSPARAGLSTLWRETIRSLPLLMFGLIVLALSGVAGWLATRGAQKFFQRQVQAKLLRDILTRGTGVLVFLAGAYVVLRVSGLTQLALTLVGGTGLIGLAVGIAFRDITENFLASIFLSVQRPFEMGDLVKISEITGYVQQLNVRTTVLMTLDGNLAQIPNATVYKTNLVNFTANPNRREDFVVGIGYDDPIGAAQEIARKVLADHPAVLKDPEPWVLADSMGSSTVNLRVYFWLNGQEHSYLKVRSSVIRLVKRAFQEQGVSMPDEAREVVFPQGVPVMVLEQKQQESPEKAAKESQNAVPVSPAPPRTAPKKPVLSEALQALAEQDADAVSTKAEGGLSSEAGALKEQAHQSTPLNAGENLLHARDSERP